MTDKVGIRIEGLNRFVRDLGRLDPELVAELKTVNRELADDVAATARGLVPKRDGRLSASIRAGSTKRSGVVRSGKKSVPYAGVVHFGWPARNIRPRPFLYDALDQRRGEVQRRYLKALETVAGKVN